MDVSGKKDLGSIHGKQKTLNDDKVHGFIVGPYVNFSEL